MKPLYFVSCTKGRTEDTRLFLSLQKQKTWNYRFFENNSVGLSERYNSILVDRAGRDEIVVFVHDDVLIGDLFIEEKLNDAASKLGFAVIGVAGNAEFKIDPAAPVTLWMQPPADKLSGAVEYAFGHQRRWNVFGVTPARCMVLDGMFLAVDLARIGDVRFDLRFKFHFYDLDFCLSAHRRGLAVGTMNVYTSHTSPGDYDSPAFRDAQAAFRTKWLATSPPAT